MEDARPNKRPRGNSSPPTSHAEPVPLTDIARDECFWFDDGNIVLVAENVGFCIYKGLLSSQSPVFSDLFSGTSLRADENIDDIPVARIYDSPTELRHLFRVLLPRSQKE